MSSKKEGRKEGCKDERNMYICIYICFIPPPLQDGDKKNSSFNFEGKDGTAFNFDDSESDRSVAAPRSARSSSIEAESVVLNVGL